ncbi:MAG: class I SAM-dependent methyltransferase [Rhodoferax sp.]
MVVANLIARIDAIGIARSPDEYRIIQGSYSIKSLKIAEASILDSVTKEEFTVSGRCLCCSANVSFCVDQKSGGQRRGSQFLPNWRERMVCPLCGMNNRQRLVATLVRQELNSKVGRNVYFMEQVTPLYSWAAKTLKGNHIVGSEYFGAKYQGGASIRNGLRSFKLFCRFHFSEAVKAGFTGIRHEDIESLSFPNNSLDLIVSNDVFEHVPNYLQGFQECCRVLRTGGMMIVTIPFHAESNESVCRASLIGGKFQYIHPPAFHGNPVSKDGSLVFTDFGWDLIKEIKMRGFSDAYMSSFAAPEYGHLGNNLDVLVCIK